MHPSEMNEVIRETTYARHLDIYWSERLGHRVSKLYTLDGLDKLIRSINYDIEMFGSARIKAYRDKMIALRDKFEKEK